MATTPNDSSSAAIIATPPIGRVALLAKRNSISNENEAHRGSRIDDDD